MPGFIRFARGRPRHVPGQMNKTEQRYSEHLEARKLAGEILDWKFPAPKFPLAKLTTYNPDFQVMLPNGEIEFHEVKGFMEDDAAVKCKVFAETWWMYRLVIVKARAKKNGGGWELKEVGN